METYSVLFPPVKRHTNPTPTTTPDPTTNNVAADVSSADSGAAAFTNRVKPPQPPLFVPPGNVVFRLICHASRVGGLIGKSGCIVKQLQQQTNSRIRVEDPPDGSDHRVISVVASPAVANKLLVYKNQGGAVIGKGGMVVEKIKKETGCRIMVINSECSLPGSFANDEIVEIEGNILSVKKALVLVTGRLQEFPPLGKNRTFWTKPLETESLPVTSGERPIIQPMPSTSTYHDTLHGPATWDSDKASKIDTKAPEQEVVFKMLCPSDRVGGIIGKGGSIIEAIKDKTGASIFIGPHMPDCDERLITIAAKESMESQCSPAQNAALIVFKRSIEAGLEKGLDSDFKGSFVLARLLVPSFYVGSLLGKGGARIAEMRKATGTGLRFLLGNQVPKCAPENVEILQITGELANVQNALFAVTSRLRDNLFSVSIPSGRGSYNTLRTEDSVFSRVKDPRTFGSHLFLDNISDNPNQDKSLTNSMESLQISNNIDRPTSTGSIMPQTVDGVNQGNIMDNDESLPSDKGGMEINSESRSAVVTNTTIEIVVPDAVIGSIYGENGSNLDRLRQISGAKVVVHEPRPGTNLSTVVISGTPDETQVAQSLMQAFLLSGS
ncbi:RNA-binding KH domain-containing protein [Striga hermonthica]|uniref:RNA-binding KH domain-containing protein n=1 Tax=Striga hermonthica TaxID=68872 RepID=A0A9N7MII1_STRHE|nr:RNA-binding KH domain-containing protein [Striga hermonthica]